MKKTVSLVIALVIGCSMLWGCKPTCEPSENLDRNFLTEENSKETEREPVSETEPTIMTMESFLPECYIEETTEEMTEHEAEPSATIPTASSEIQPSEQETQVQEETYLEENETDLL